MGDILAIVIVLGLILWGPLGSWVAAQKGRGGMEGFLLGAVFGPFGVLVEALLPTDGRALEEGAAAAELARRRDAAYFEQARAESQRRRAELKARRARQAAFLAGLPGRIWAALGEIGQPIAVALAVTIPVVVGLVILLRGR
jgi:hypothetical protein